jgi:hypothetical protein
LRIRVLIASGVVLLAAGALLASPAQAQEVCLAHQTEPGEVIQVVKPGKVYEFVTLAKNGERQAAKDLLACWLQGGEHVLATPVGGIASVRVLSGPFEGCIGEMPEANLADCKN